MKWKMFLCAAALVPTLAFAQQKTAEQWFTEGSNEYNLGNFEAAVKAFKEGFTAEPVERKKAVYLYNVAESYRQMKDCTNAQFFYKRFLSLKETDTVKPITPQVRKEVEDRIRELEACAKEQEAIKNRPPTGITKPDGNEVKPTEVKPTEVKPTEVAKLPPPDGDDVDDGGDIRTTIENQPKVLSARLAFGGSKISVGDVSVPLQATAAVIGGYPIAVNEKLTLEAGVGLGFTRVKWDAMETTGKTGTASMTAVMANAGLSYEIASKMALRGDLGLGMLFFGNVSQSPFTERAQTEGGALAMFHVRAGASFDYAITPNIITTVPLAFGFSPAKSGLSGAIVSFDFMVGVGYRM
jgi:tetratricopeptide (TPR) repeat protein